MAGLNVTGIPQLAELQRYGIDLTRRDVVEASLYDYAVYPTGGATQFNFFALPIGQGLSSHPGNAGNTKTTADTNLRLSSQLPVGYGFLVQAVEIDFEPGSVSTANTYTPMAPQSFTAVAAGTVQNGIQDVNALAVSGQLTFLVAAKAVIEDAPLGLFPPRNRLDMFGAVASNSTTAGEVMLGRAKFGGRPYTLRIPTFLNQQVNFGIALNFPVAVATPSGFNGRIGVRLSGLLVKPVQ